MIVRRTCGRPNFIAVNEISLIILGALHARGAGPLPILDPPRAPLPLASHEVVLGRGPFSLAGERQMLQRHAIDVLVCKASGGAATEAKLVAARELGVPVVMVRRPPREPGPAVETIEAALDWLAGLDHSVEAMRMP